MLDVVPALFPLPGGSAVGAHASAETFVGSVEELDFRALYQHFFPHVWRWAIRLGVPQSALDDVVQEVFLTVHRRIDEFEGRSTLRTWIFGVTLGITRNYRRRSGNAALVDASTEVDALAENAPHPEAVAQQTEEIELLQTILEGLDDDRREVFVLAELEELTLAEIATVLGVNPNTVSSRLRLARQAVRAAWERAAARDTWRHR